MKMISVFSVMFFCIPQIGYSSSQFAGIHKFVVDGASNKTVKVSWFSDPNAFYTLEHSNSIDGGWSDVSDAQNIESQDFFCEKVLSVTNNSCFYRVREVDSTGPTITFATPVEDETIFDPSQNIQVHISDVSNIDETSIELYLDDTKIDSANYSFKDNALVYAPTNGVLGVAGQEISIYVIAKDQYGNESRGTSCFKIARPFECVAQRVVYVGDPDLGSYTYSIEGIMTNEMANIVLSSKGDEYLIFCNAAEEDFPSGEYIVSQIPTNTFFRRVLYAELCENGLYVSTTNATLSEIFQGSFTTTSSLEVVDISAIARKSKLLSNSNIKRLDVNIDSGLMNFHKHGSLGSDLSKDFSATTVSLASGLEMTILGACETKGDIGLLDTDIEVFMEGEIVFSITEELTLASAIESYNAGKDYLLAPTLIPIIPPFLWMEVDYSLYGLLSIDASVIASIIANGEFGATFCLHARRKNGEWIAYHDNWASGWISGDGNVNIGGELSAKFGCGLSVKTYLESIVGPYIEVGPFIKGTATKSWDLSNGAQTVEKKIVGGLEGKIGVTSHIPGLSKEFATTSVYKVLYDSKDKKTPPEFLWFPSDAVYSLGETVTLSPTVYGDEPIIYQWFKDGEPINRDAREIAFIVTPYSVGTYTCRATNTLGECSKTVIVGTNETGDGDDVDATGTWMSNIQVLAGYGGEEESLHSATIYWHITSDGTGWVEERVSGVGTFWGKAYVSQVSPISGEPHKKHIRFKYDLDISPFDSYGFDLDKLIFYTYGSPVIKISSKP